jgi:predicted metal-dependent enzyme (double-stranded beta helix superfamily)
MSLEFDGKATIIQRISQAVSQGSNDTEITNNIRHALCDLMHDTEIVLPDLVFQNKTDHYARRLIYRDEILGYTIMAMTWGPEQATPIHDHDGLWCVEAVWHGQIEVVQYEMVEDQGDKAHFEPRTTMQAGPGSAGSLIPPHEYHTIANPSDSEVAVTLHIYADSLEQCCVFKPLGDGWFERVEKQLSLDAA